MRRAQLSLAFWYLMWPAVHIGNYTLPREFFEHVLLGLSVYAIIVTKQDVYHTVKVEENGK